jgi:hypothetical protein
MSNIIDYKLYGFQKSINEALDPQRKRRLLSDLKLYCDETGSEYSEVCKLLNLGDSGLEKLDKMVIDWLDNNVGSGKWYVDESNGKINVDGSVNIYSGYRSNGFEELPAGVDFGKVTGDFTIEGALTTLRGFPEEIGGRLSISNNKLTSLSGCTQKIGSSFNCSNNQLTSLEGGPKEVGGDYNCRANELENLKGCPEEVRSFDCSNNRINTLVGGPKRVTASFDASGNYLDTLEGFPQDFDGWRIDVKNNNLWTAEGIDISGSSKTLEAKKNLYPESVLRQVYSKAREYDSWIAAYLWLITTERFKRMSKAQRDPVRDYLSEETIKTKVMGLSKIWKTEVVEDPAVKRILKKAGLMDRSGNIKDDGFKQDVELGSDLDDLGF